ncbi:hypothetical protein [Streptomyces sp. NPDC006285]
MSSAELLTALVLGNTPARWRASANARLVVRQLFGRWLRRT